PEESVPSFRRRRGRQAGALAGALGGGAGAALRSAPRGSAVADGGAGLRAPGAQGDAARARASGARGADPVGSPPRRAAARLRRHRRGPARAPVARPLEAPQGGPTPPGGRGRELPEYVAADA